MDLNEDREKLFHAWQELGAQIERLGMHIRGCSVIVQNDGIVINEDQIKQWRDMVLVNYTDVDSTKETLKNLTKVTLEHVRKPVPLYDVYIHPESDDVWYEPASEEARVKNLGIDGCVNLLAENLGEYDAQCKVTQVKAAMKIGKS